MKIQTAAGFAPAESDLAYIFQQFYANQPSGEYSEWVLVSYATSTGLLENGRHRVDRSSWPTVFRDYLPEIASGDKTHLLATLEGRTYEEFEECIVLYLGRKWALNIMLDLVDRRLVGNNIEISDMRPKTSALTTEEEKWELRGVRIIRNIKERIRTAYIDYVNETQSETDGCDTTYTAMWQWTDY